MLCGYRLFLPSGLSRTSPAVTMTFQRQLSGRTLLRLQRNGGFLLRKNHWTARGRRGIVDTGNQLPPLNMSCQVADLGRVDRYFPALQNRTIPTTIGLAINCATITTGISSLTGRQQEGS